MVNTVAPLWTNQINTVLSTHPDTTALFRGTFACDKIPHTHPLDQYGRFRPWLMVVNTHPAHQPGEHWLLLGADNVDRLHVFDSYGNDLVTFYNNRWLTAVARRFQSLHQNTDAYQGDTTNVCGHCCIFAAAQRGQLGRYDFSQLPFLTPLCFRHNDSIIAELVSTDLDLHDVLFDFKSPHRG